MSGADDLGRPIAWSFYATRGLLAKNTPYALTAAGGEQTDARVFGQVAAVSVGGPLTTAPTYPPVWLPAIARKVPGDATVCLIELCLSALMARSALRGVDWAEIRTTRGQHGGFARCRAMGPNSPHRRRSRSDVLGPSPPSFRDAEGRVPPYRAGGGARATFRQETRRRSPRDFSP